MATLLPTDTEVLAGLELGGIPLATAIALFTDNLCVFVRKEAKAYGTEKAVEGPSVRGKRTTVIEDVVTTGGAIIDGAAKLRARGADVHTGVCAIWRGTDLTPLINAGLELRWAISGAELEDLFSGGFGSDLRLAGSSRQRGNYTRKLQVGERRWNARQVPTRLAPSIAP